MNGRPARSRDSAAAGPPQRARERPRRRPRTAASRASPSALGAEACAGQRPPRPPRPRPAGRSRGGEGDDLPRLPPALQAPPPRPLPSRRTSSVSPFLLPQANARSHTCRTALALEPRGRRPRKRGSSEAASRVIASRSSRPGSSAIRLCGASPVGTKMIRERPSCQSASWASARWPRWGGLKASRGRRCPRPHLR